MVVCCLSVTRQVLAQAGLLAQQEAAAAVAQAAEAGVAAEAAQQQQAMLAAGPPVPAVLPASAPATPDGKRGMPFTQSRRVSIRVAEPAAAASSALVCQLTLLLYVTEDPVARSSA